MSPTNNTLIKHVSLTLLALLIFIVGHAQPELIVNEILAFREEQHREFLDPEKSPLEKRDRKKFKGLHYYPIDLNFYVKATFVLNETPVLFRMPTTTTRLPEYSRYGDLYFTIERKEFKLEVYRNPEISMRPGYEDYLFIPFTDETNGDETYDIGRYLEFRIPKSQDIYINFNLSYNPYCSYSHRYSCPIPPQQNHLPVRITAGEMKYDKRK